MQLKMRENSLFAILLRSPWWYTLLIAAAIVGVAFAILRPQHVIYGVAVAVPFVGLAVFACYRQMGQPSAQKTAATIEWIRTARAREFMRVLTAAYSEAGYQTTPYKGNAADLQLERDGRLTLVSCKRAKAATTGVEPLRTLATVGEGKEASALTLITLGDLTSEARAFADENGIEILGGEALATLVGPHVGRDD